MYVRTCERLFHLVFAASMRSERKARRVFVLQRRKRMNSSSPAFQFLCPTLLARCVQRSTLCVVALALLAICMLFEIVSFLSCITHTLWCPPSPSHQCNSRMQSGRAYTTSSSGMPLPPVTFGVALHFCQTCLHRGGGIGKQQELTLAFLLPLKKHLEELCASGEGKTAYYKSAT